MWLPIWELGGVVASLYFSSWLKLLLLSGFVKDCLCNIEVILIIIQLAGKVSVVGRMLCILVFTVI